MLRSRRWFLNTLLAGGTAWLAGCGTRGPEVNNPTRTERIDQALASAARFLLGCQSADGSWQSDVYGPFKDGPSLTPMVLRTLLALPATKDIEAGCDKGAAYLAARVQSDGTIDVGPYGLAYPVYTSAGAVQVLSQPSNVHYRKARDAWLLYLRERQLTEDLGWKPADKPYGGWGYSPRLPRKPNAGEPLPPLTESNLSATLFALEALQAAGLKSDETAFRKALVFVQRCQNYADEPKREAAFDDGGFFFIYDDPVRNKAGVAGKDRTGRERYVSYGSTTADGLRALLLCGQPLDDPRVVAALSWLEANFRGDGHPGNYAEDREHNRGAVFYYYCCSVAQALRAARVEELRTPRGGKVRWAEVLVDELMQRQRKDGSWSNSLVPQREDDPLVATSLATLALVTC